MSTPPTASGTLALTRALVRRPSITPDDAGCQALLAERLTACGFACETLQFGEVTNLWARFGMGRPLFAFVGHTDVVPTGPVERWRYPPFDAALQDGLLFGRGVADMKGSVAAFVTAVERYLAAGSTPQGSLALLLTSDEEGPSVDGVARVARVLEERSEVPDWCLVGEPSSEHRIGDTVKIGRRGSLNARLRVQGVQGHVAYPHKARNPIHALAPVLAQLAATEWDRGNERFPATTFQVSNIQAGTGATNVIPGEVEVLFNFRFSTEVTSAELEERTEAILRAHALTFELEWTRSAEPFLTREGRLTEALSRAVKDVTGNAPELSTAGGTSDGRFLAPLGSQIVELGPLNDTIHQIDERLPAADLDTLSSIYERLLGTLLSV